MTMEKKYNLFLDDERVPFSDSGKQNAYSYMKNEAYVELEWVIVKSYDEFVKQIETNGLPEVVSFDHDLADEHYLQYQKHRGKGFDYDEVKEKTGYHCAKWMTQYCVDNKKKFPKWFIHTMNPNGWENIKGEILSYLKHFESDATSN